MKKYLLSYILLAIFIACKKDKPAVTPLPEKEKKWLVTTVAGEGAASFVNGPVNVATFHFPEDVAVLPDGTLYVTDVLNFCVRKIAGGFVNTFAGGNGFGIIDDRGVAAKFKNPYSIAADASGNLFTTDENDPRIRKITGEGLVTTFAGTAIPGFADGPAGTAQFGQGNSIVADPQGNVYLTDGGRIRKISNAGIVTSLAGAGVSGYQDGAAADARFSFPGGIALDKQGNLFIVDRGNYRIRKLTPASIVSTVAGSGIPGSKDGVSSEAQFGPELHDIVVDSKGNLFVQDENRIRMITPQGVVSTIAGSTAGFTDGEGKSAKFEFLAGMSIDAKDNLFVADLVNNRIRKLSLE